MMCSCWASECGPSESERGINITIDIDGQAIKVSRCVCVRMCRIVNVCACAGDASAATRCMCMNRKGDCDVEGTGPDYVQMCENDGYDNMNEDRPEGKRRGPTPRDSTH